MDYKKTMTAKEKEAQYFKYKKIINDLAHGGNDKFGYVKPDQDVLDYLTWEKLSYQDRQKCFSEWDEYYSKIKDTRAFAIYRELTEASKTKNMVRYDELLKENAELLKEQQVDGKFELARPKCINPYDFMNKPNVTKYKTAVWGLNALQEESKNIESGGLGGIDW